jgi:hypothetical protein
MKTLTIGLGERIAAAIPCFTAQVVVEWSVATLRASALGCLQKWITLRGWESNHKPSERLRTKFKASNFILGISEAKKEMCCMQKVIRPPCAANWRHCYWANYPNVSRKALDQSQILPED